MKVLNALKPSCFIKNNSNYLILIFTPLLFLGVVFVTSLQAQTANEFVIDNETEFSKNLFSLKKSGIISIPVSEKSKLQGTINFKEGNLSNYKLIGSILGHPNASYTISKFGQSVSGRIILKDENEAYQILTNDLNEVIIKKVDINTLICTDIQKADGDDVGYNLLKAATAQPDLQSLPGSKFTIYLDFDGERVTNTSWNKGGTIDAKSNNYNDATILGIWRIIAEDFSPFNVNVTTNRAVYDATPIRQRIMTIFTTTTTAAPGAGGVAYINSFSSNSDEPCWVFNKGTRAAGETGSHEVGHTLGLGHDGISGGTTYYSGHGEWSPIMGWSVNKKIGQWSKGEYNNANRSNQDDLAIISGSRNKFGYKNDDTGNSLNDAKELVVNSDGTVVSEKNEGVITTRQDVDVYSFITAGGPVTFDFQPNPWHPNLNIQARLLNAKGEELAIDNPFKDLTAKISADLPGGTYFLEIDGKGEGNLTNGYSDYASIGNYSISGSYTPGDNNQPPIANFTATQDCSEFIFTSTSINTVTSYSWDFGDGSTSTEEEPTHIYTQNGNYTVKLTVTNNNGTDEAIKEQFASVTIATKPEDTEASFCSGEPATVNLKGSNGYVWYDSEDGTKVVATGNKVNLPDLTGTKTYYVAGTSQPIIEGSGGLKSIDQNNGKIHQGGFYLVFNTKEETILKSAKVFAQGSGARTIELRNSNGDLVTSKDINIVDGESVILIDITIPAGKEWQIGFAETANLFRTNVNNLGYPFTISDIVTITGSTASEDAQSYYYYLYDWKVTTTGGCESTERAEVVITAGKKPSKPTVSISEERNELRVNDTYERYTWYLNNQEIQGADSQTYVAQEAGTYQVEVFNAEGCGTLSDDLVLATLSVETILDNAALRAFPNPVKETLFIEGLETIQDAQTTTIVNLLGQKVKSFNGKVSQIDFSDIGNGIYFLTINNQVVEKIIKTN